MHGQPALDRLELEYAVQRTNDILGLEYRNNEFLEMMKNIKKAQKS